MAELHAKALVRTVARAFYDDDVVMMLDALCREKYLIDHEHAGRGPLEDKFGLQAKQLRRILQQLYDDQLVDKYVRKYRDPNAPKGTRKKKRTFWYINYLHFVKLVRLRLHKMISIINTIADEQMTQNTVYTCETCGTNFDQDTALLNMRPDGNFGCEVCAQDDIESQLRVEGDDKKPAGAAGPSGRSLNEKREEQISEVAGLRDGIVEILTKIDNFPIPPPTNLPGDHIENALQDHKEQQDRDDEIARSGGARQGGGPRGPHATFTGATGATMSVRIAGMEDDNGGEADDDNKPQAALPAWMTKDVTGQTSSSALQDAKERSAKRQKLSGPTKSGSKAGASALKQALAEAAVQEQTAQADIPALQRSESERQQDEERARYEATTKAMVAGVEMLLRDIGKPEQDKMSPEEYERYVILAKGPAAVAAAADAAGAAGGAHDDDDDDDDDMHEFM